MPSWRAAVAARERSCWMLTVGQYLPDFALANQDGVFRSRASYADRWLVLYVYPKDDTPGCTRQATALTAARAEFAAHGVSVVGVSADDAGSHGRFCKRYSLELELLADP